MLNMETPNPSAPLESPPQYWRRVLRPLAWWLLLVLVLYGIRLHQRWMAQTKLNFSVTVNGRDDYSAPTATFDGQPAFNSQLIPLGWHAFAVTHPKGVDYTTNLFIWYGGHDFGRIDLKRATGTLRVEAVPPAVWLAIRGPEYQLTLPVSSGTNLTIPTDEYTVTAKYAFSEERSTAVVSTYLPATVSITPRFGAARLESDPAGATVLDDTGRSLGTTPVTLSQLKTGIWKFSLEHDGYESVLASLVVSLNQTNLFQTNLVNRYYAAALRSARSSIDAGRYAEAALSADEALKYQADDPVATALRQEALGLNHLALARMNGDRESFAPAIAELNQALKFMPDHAEAKQLLADYTRREAEHLAAEQKRAAELAEQERRRQEAEQAERQAREKTREIYASFNALVRGAENANRFPEHELVATGEAGTIGAAIKQTLSDGDPAFRIVHSEQPRPDLLTLQARQSIFLNYRDCFVVVGQVRAGETRIYFKVLEYDHPPNLSLLGGLITATVSQTGKNPEQQAQFQQQIREGARMVEERIRRVIGK